MKRAILACSLTAFLWAVTASASEWTGYISDAKCGAAHADGSEKSIKCVQACVKGGQAPVFVTAADKKVLKIANADKVKEHLGHKVKVTGSLKGDTLTIDTIAMAH
ncbi:MAG: hypothetical protein RMK57_16460 [Bryobacterales bacterium]|nr:hypothetical protein [Bryobacteraceae bacterium]MDW8356115.1 hypothetical protein [Bryobacterales bacterium]